MSDPALTWLYSLADQERGVGWNPRASVDSQWKLGRTRALLDLAGAPDGAMRVALIAGTKGKGSTAAMLASILGAAGIRCGLFTKPHLQAYRERVRVDGQSIASSELEQEVDQMRRLANALPPAAGEPTTFEVTTALALAFFARRECTMAVVEVGLGGRLDATNAITDPYLSVITSISYDHTAILGKTLAQIATEKAGIMRPRRPALLAQQRPAAMRALRRVCRAVGARCEVVPPLGSDPPLAGAHQRQNAALAIAASRLMAPDKVSDGTIEYGLRRLRWPGRFEVIDHAARLPMTGGDARATVVLDGAHNGASAVGLSATLVDFAAGQPITLVIGINRDKDALAVLKPLLRVSERVWVTQTADNLRALPATDLAQLCQRLGTTPRVEPDLAAALRQARADSHCRPGVICVTGSLLLVGQTRTVLGLPSPERLW